MTKLERCLYLIRHFEADPKASVRTRELASQFGTCKETIKRDLTTLSRNGMLPLIYSGGVWRLYERDPKPVWD